MYFDLQCHQIAIIYILRDENEYRGGVSVMLATSKL